MITTSVAGAAGGAGGLGGAGGVGGAMTSGTGGGIGTGTGGGSCVLLLEVQAALVGLVFGGTACLGVGDRKGTISGVT